MRCTMFMRGVTIGVLLMAAVGMPFCGPGLPPAADDPAADTNRQDAAVYAAAPADEKPSSNANAAPASGEPTVEQQTAIRYMASTLTATTPQFCPQSRTVHFYEPPTTVWYDYEGMEPNSNPMLPCIARTL